MGVQSTPPTGPGSASTCATFGVPQDGRIGETHPQRPINPYGASKYMVVRMLADVDNAHGIRSVALRYFNAAGADPQGEVGESHAPETHLVPIVLEVAAGRRRAIEVFGTTHATPDGRCVRDYGHVADLAIAHVHALDYLRADGSTIALNLGTGTGYSVLEVIERARQVTGRPIIIENAQPRAGDPHRLVAEPGRARSILGWSPSRSDLRTILEDAWRWHTGRDHVTGARL